MPDQMPLVSVIIPAHQAAPTLSRALDSALGQAYPALEVIIADDGSTDDTPRIAEAYRSRDSRVHYHRQANQGAGSARNLAIAHSSGELLAFLDDDDEWRPGKLARQVEIFLQHPSVGLVFTDSLSLNTTNGRSQLQSDRYARSLAALRQQAVEVFEDGFVLGPNLRRVLFDHNFIHVCSAMMRRSAFDRVGPFMQAPGPEDFDLWMRASRLITFAYCSRLFSTYYSHALSTSRTEAWFVRHVAYQKRCLTSPDYDDLRAEVSQRLRHQYRHLIFHYGRHWQPRRAWTAFRASGEAGFDGLSALCALGSLFGPWPFRVAGRLIWP